MVEPVYSGHHATPVTWPLWTGKQVVLYKISTTSGAIRGNYTNIII